MRKVFKTVVFLSVCLLLLAGCRHDARPEEYFLELDNKELEREIIAFTKEKEKENGNRNFMVNVGCKDINDSIKRYILFYKSQGWSWRVSPFHFVCRVGGRDVMFTMIAANSYPDMLFDMDEWAYMYYLRKYYPQEYEAQRTGREWYQTVYDGENCYLTFLNGKLIDKRISRGCHVDKFKIKIGEKEFYI